jgi:hypothetical protein
MHTQRTTHLQTGLAVLQRMGLLDGLSLEQALASPSAGLVYMHARLVAMGVRVPAGQPRHIRQPVLAPEAPHPAAPARLPEPRPLGHDHKRAAAGDFDD